MAERKPNSRRASSIYLLSIDRTSRDPVSAFLGAKQTSHSRKGKRGLKSVRHSLSPVSNKIIRLASKHLTPPCPLAATDVASRAQQPLFSFCCVRAPVKAAKRRTSFSVCILLVGSCRVTLGRGSSRSFHVPFSPESRVFHQREHASIPLSADPLSFRETSFHGTKERSIVACRVHGLQLTYAKIAATRAKR